MSHLCCELHMGSVIRATYSADMSHLYFWCLTVALQLNRLVERTQHYTTSSAVFQLPPGAVPSICTAPTLATPPRVVSSTPAQPLSSILKPATLSLPPSTHTLTLGPAGGEPKAAIPVQFVLPSHGLSPAVAVDSRKYLEIFLLLLHSSDRTLGHHWIGRIIVDL